MNYNIILFDGVCNLCNEYVNFLIRIDKKDKFRFIAMQNPSASSILKGKNIPFEINDGVIFLSDKGEVFLNTDAVRKIIALLPIFMKLCFFPFLIMPRKLQDWLYNKILKNRYKFRGIKSSCMVPPENVRHKFII